MTLLEAVAVVFGLLSVILSIRQNIWCWVAGLIQVLLYIVIFYRVHLYSDVILHIIYVVLNIYGWHYWRHGPANRNTLDVSRLSSRSIAGWVLVSLCASAVWGWGMSTFTNAAVPYLNAFTAVTALIAQFLMTRKKIECWIFWIAVDVVAIGVYLYTALYLTVVLYASFMVMSSLGFVTWRKSLRAEDTQEE